MENRANYINCWSRKDHPDSVVFKFPIELMEQTNFPKRATFTRGTFILPTQLIDGKNKISENINHKDNSNVGYTLTIVLNSIDEDYTGKWLYEIIDNKINLTEKID